MRVKVNRVHGTKWFRHRQTGTSVFRSVFRKRVATAAPLHATAGAAEYCDDSNPTTLRNIREKWCRLVPVGADAPVPLWSALRSVWGLTKGVRVWVALGLLCLIVAAACELAYPHLASKVLEAAQQAAAASAVDGTAKDGLWHALRSPPPSFTPLFVILAVNAVGETVSAALRGVCSSLVTVKTVRRLRASVFEALLQQELPWFQQRGRDSAALAARITNDCEAVARIVSLNLNIALRYSVQSFGAVIYLTLCVNTFIGAACFVTAALMSAISLKYGVFSRQVTRGERDQSALASSLAEESLRSMSLVKAHGYEESEKRRFHQQLQVLADLSYCKLVGYTSYLLGYTGVWHVGSMIVLFVGGCMTFQGSMTFAQLTAAYLYSEVVFDAAKTICDQIASILENLGTVDMVLRLLQLGERTSAAADPSKLRPPDEVWEDGMSLDGVSFTYPNRKRTVLRDVSISFPANRATAIVGTSGSGKSTVAALLARVLQPTAGFVQLGGINVERIDRDWMRRGIAKVPQMPTLFTASVFVNISYGFPEASLQDVEDAARAANAHDFICRLPGGYNTIVKDSTLSGGQRQRIAIARALFRKPKVLILDEATSALDAGTEAAVQQTLDTIIQRSNLTVVIIAHRLATVQNCSSIVVLHKGSVAEMGTHDELNAADGIYSGLVAQQSLGDMGSVGRDSDDDEGRDVSDDSAGEPMPRTAVSL